MALWCNGLLRSCSPEAPWMHGNGRAEEAQHCRYQQPHLSLQRPVPDILSGLYRTSLEAPEAFKAEFEATTSRVLSILESSPDSSKVRGRQCGLARPCLCQVSH